MKKIYLRILKILDLKSLAILRSLISYDKKGAQQLSINDDLEIYNEHKKYFGQFIQPGTGKVILDFGCGTGRYLTQFQNFQFTYLVDISKENLKLASQKAKNLKIKHQIIRSSLFSLDRKVDYFFSVGVFGQFYQIDTAVLQKIESLLIKNGKAVFTVKIDNATNNEVLAIEEGKLQALLVNYNHKVHKKYLTGVSGIAEYFYTIELFKN